VQAIELTLKTNPLADAFSHRPCWKVCLGILIGLRRALQGRSANRRGMDQNLGTCDHGGMVSSFGTA